jgi:hypothetical protein
MASGVPELTPFRFISLVGFCAPARISAIFKTELDILHIFVSQPFND